MDKTKAIPFTGRITIEILEQWGACFDDIESFKKTYPQGVDYAEHLASLRDRKRYDWERWVVYHAWEAVAGDQQAGTDLINSDVACLVATTSKAAKESEPAASGNDSRLAASGYGSRLAASGNDSRLAASGYGSRLAASGERSVISSSGMNATAKGVDGTWIALAEFDDECNCIGFAVGCIGRDGLKANTEYRASGGKLVPVENDEDSEPSEDLS